MRAMQLLVRTWAQDVGLVGRVERRGSDGSGDPYTYYPAAHRDPEAITAGQDAERNADGG